MPKLLGSSNSLTNNERVDLNVVQGQRLLVKVVGVNNDVDLRFNNLVSRSGTTVFVYGTAGADRYSVTTGASLSLTANGTVYTFANSTARTLSFSGAAPVDLVQVTGSTAGLTLTINGKLATAYSPTSATSRGSTSVVMTKFADASDLALDPGSDGLCVDVRTDHDMPAWIMATEASTRETASPKLVASPTRTAVAERPWAAAEHLGRPTTATADRDARCNVLERIAPRLTPCDEWSSLDRVFEELEELVASDE